MIAFNIWWLQVAGQINKWLRLVFGNYQIKNLFTFIVIN